MLEVYQSNRLEVLAEALAAGVSAAPQDPFTAEVIVVESQAVARWLSMVLADRVGVAANLRFPLPAGFIWEVFRAVLPQVPRNSPFRPEALAWRVLAALDDPRRLPGATPLYAYLRDADDYRRYELALRVAETLDQYVVYRPDWILDWEEGGGNHWQAGLWRRLVADLGKDHWARVYHRFLAHIREAGIPAGSLPARVSLFGVTALSPGYLDVLSHLAEYLEVHLFQLNPCREYWGDILSPRGIARRAGDAAPAPDYLTSGNSLLASLGQHGRDLLDQILEYPHRVQEVFQDPGDDNLLHTLQSDVLNLREGGLDEPPLELDRQDDSLQIHACHGPMREVEVLHDRLLDLFDRYRDLEPSDVVVMTPDMARYGPYIEAVFESRREHRIPWSLQTAGSGMDSEAGRVLFALLEVPGSRLDVNQVLAFLEEAGVRRRFSLDEGDLDRIRDWLRDSGIRWGMDGADRRRLGLPGLEENTWRAGLDRLLLGYALPGEGDTEFAGILPCPDVEGSDAEVLGRLLRFTDDLFRLREGLSGSRSVAQWVVVLRGLLEDFLEPEDTDGLAGLWRCLAGLEEAAGDTARPVSLAVVTSFLSRALAAAPGGGGLLAGGVSFTGMLPLRGVPFRVVCLLGMNDGVFPRPRRPYGFDLMAVEYRRGDRNRRGDDYQLFLDALLAAREHLLITYQGRDPRENSVIPPSQVVSELLDYLRQGFHSPGGNLEERLVTVHPLQPFSPRYFQDDERLFTYSHAYGKASQALVSGGPEVPVFFPEPLPLPEEAPRAVSLSELLGFYGHPAKYLLRYRLGLELDTGQEVLETREAFVLDGLSGYRLRERLVEAHLAGLPVSGVRRRQQADAALPLGTPGERLFQITDAGLSPDPERLRALRASGPLAPLNLDLRLGAWRLTGVLDGLTPQGLVDWRPGRLRGKDRLSLWLRHLVLQILAPDGVERESHLLTTDGDWVLSGVADAGAHLEALLEHFAEGAATPLHLYPETSFAYARGTAEQKPDPLALARKAWEGGWHGNGEGDDPWYALALAGVEPLDARFESTALALMGPLLKGESRP